MSDKEKPMVPSIPETSRDELLESVKNGMAARGEGAANPAEDAGGSALPAIALVADGELCARNSPLPPPIIEGLVNRGEVTLLAAGSKAGKSWLGLQAAKCVGAGVPFLGFPTVRGVAVYLNTEIQSAAWEERCRQQNAALGIDAPQVFHASTRGLDLTIYNVVPAIKAALAAAGLSRVDLIFIDPYYTLAAGLDENAAGDVARVMLGLQKLAEELGAAIWIAHHFTKGNAAGKSVLDRASGSGAFARAADNYLTLTEDKDGKMILEVVRRSMRPASPLELVFDFPIWRVVGEADAIIPPKPGRPRAYTVETLVGLFNNDPEVILTRQEMIERGIGRGSITQLLAEAVQAGKIIKTSNQRCDAYRLKID